MPKSSIRETMLAHRRHLSDASCFGRSLAAQKRLLAIEAFAAAATVALYSPVRNEVFTEEIFAVARRSDKRVAYPRVQGDRLEFVEVDELEELRPGAYGILEPAGDRRMPLADIEFAVVPGIAFDRAGHRLGYGKGFYDRVLHGGVRGVVAGLCFSFQVVDELPAEAHDVRMDIVVTDECVLVPGGAAGSAGLPAHIAKP